MKDLVEREGLFYKKFIDVPFTGEEQKEFENWEKKILKSVTTTTDSYWKKGPARTVRRTVPGSGTTTTDSYHSKEPTRRVRETVLGFRIIRMGLLTQNSQEPIRTVRR
jgi:hypothetical protein